ncbi:hypothetical protein DAEQUDRAFT_213158 [Daedalea quercina L-15889]|uniref:Uncharacterized protein n=1 Tax=Daedalea quercina L-15889 TaxID=1314783 RepID=A0A165R2S6_9APHY|nr:hypothetical protein DAEQUDRAFT_213158 [Daedalea quercina L-15889]
MFRIGFGGIFSGAGYVLLCGDAYNGSGITTAWSLTYLLFNLKNSLKTQRNVVSLGLSAATLASAACYGTEYFLLQNTQLL